MNSQLSLAIIALAYFCLSRSTKTLISTPFILFVDDHDIFFTTQSKIQFTVG